VARYGGEEFGVILPNTSKDGAEVVLHNVVEEIRRLAIPHPTSAVHRGIVTVSVGYATTVPAESDQVADFLNRADHALYEAKAHGRDQLICADAVRAVHTAIPTYMTNSDTMLPQLINYPTP
jgi:diguanylate cyclase (GGDEF)-like protein